MLGEVQDVGPILFLSSVHPNINAFILSPTSRTIQSYFHPTGQGPSGIYFIACRGRTPEVLRGPRSS